MCDYTGYEFGAHYEDSCCIDGFLWDCDSGDEDGFTNGGDIACPKCNTKAYLDSAKGDAVSTVSASFNGYPSCGATIWESALVIASRENPNVTREWLFGAAPFVVSDWPDRRAVYEHRASYENTIERQWPWPMKQLTHFLPESPND